ncbi:hypothetical protein M885DRAFT_584698 [Pelagophyceae sp. CCMP2097]|nr:hypothetical protein M885DRAFT_584698 [Pelagophyceae sp. CCMP2097]
MALQEHAVRDAFEDVVLYAKRHATSELLKEYVIRVLKERPDDPVAFLINELKNNPYKVQGEWAFCRDPRLDDGEAARVIRAAGAARFFRLPESQMACRARVLAAAQQCPTVLAHGAVHTAQLARAHGGLRLTPAHEQSLVSAHEQSAGAAPPAAAPYVVDVVAALVSVELEFRACAPTQERGRGALADFAPEFLAGYVRGLTASGANGAGPTVNDVVPRLSMAPPHPLDLSADAETRTARSLLDHGPQATRARQAPVDAESPAVAAVARAYDVEGEATVVEAGDFGGGRILVALTIDGELGLVEATPLSLLPWGAAVAAAAAFGSPAPTLVTAHIGAEMVSYAAFPVDASLERFEGPVADAAAAARLALWLGCALGCAHAAGAPAAVDAVKRDVESRFSEWTALAADIAAELVVAFEEYVAATSQHE